MSPTRKRMRLSSPTFDDQVADLSQDDIAAFDSLDALLSQQPRSVEDDDNPFRAESERIHASSDEPPDEPAPKIDYAAWFNADSSGPSVGFSAATNAMPGFQRPSVAGGSANSPYIPSAAALREAEKKMRNWQQDSDHAPAHDVPESPRASQIASPPQGTFTSARNAFSSMHPPETPTPVSLFRSAHAEPTPSRSHSSLQSSKRQPKPFKSPLIDAAPSMASHRQPSTPSITSPLRDRHSSASHLSTAVSPLRPSSVANHVTTQKSLGFTPTHGIAMARPKFVTPFKAVAKSGISRAPALENLKFPSTPSGPRALVNRIYPPSVSFSPIPSKQNTDRKIFDLSEHKLQISYFLGP